ncbi:hypothetical protein VTO42DRAFT_921 [Malbranchea cinnamomea]
MRARVSEEFSIRPGRLGVFQPCAPLPSSFHPSPHVLDLLLPPSSLPFLSTSFFRGAHHVIFPYFFHLLFPFFFSSPSVLPQSSLHHLFSTAYWDRLVRYTRLISD